MYCVYIYIFYFCLGDWKCFKCSNWNYKVRDKCNRCGLLKSKNRDDTEKSNNHHHNDKKRSKSPAQGDKRLSDSRSRREGDWVIIQIFV